MHTIQNTKAYWQKTLDISAKALKIDVCAFLLDEHQQMCFVASNQQILDSDLIDLQQITTPVINAIPLSKLTTNQVISITHKQKQYSIHLQPLVDDYGKQLGCFCAIYSQLLSKDFNLALIHLTVDSLQHSLSKLHSQQQQYQSINLQNFINAFSEHIWVKDLDGKYIVCNQSIENAWNKKTGQIVGKTDHDLFDVETSRLFIETDNSAKSARKPIVVSECEGTDPNNNRHWLETVKAPLIDETETIQGIIGITRNIGRHRQNEKQLLLAESVVENTINGVLVTDRDGNITEVNSAFTQITGFEREEAIGQNPRILNSGKHDTDFFAKMWNTLLVKGKWHGEIWNKRKNGDIFPQSATINAVYGQDDTINFFVAVFSDMSKQKINEQKLENLAYYDNLTQLPNRVLLRSNLQAQVEHAATAQSQLAVIMFDVDFFKHINDSLGHDVGDQLLVEVARRLENLSHDYCHVGRLSSDEFVIVLNDLTQDEMLASRVNHIKSLIEQPYRFDGISLIRMTISMGVSVYPHDSLNSENLLQNADTALHIAKQSGRNTVTFYDSAMTMNSVEHLKIQNALHEAIQEQHFHLVYQPKLSLCSGQLVGLEALIRWEHHEYGFISPAEFIPVAEKTGLIHEIGLMVLRMACYQGKQWLDNGYEFGRIAVNVASLQFQRRNFIDNVAKILQETGMPASCLELEMTESCMMYEPEQVISDLKRLGDMGIQLSVDDFGTGYSSLSYLKKLPINVLKIDQSFVCDIPFDGHNTAIAKAIIVLGHALKLDIIAEGVETKEQAAFLLENGCDQAQGYYFSRPLLASVLTSQLISSK
ncbi:GGDEF domain-containing phosphodiesterase [Shewanella sp. UCD-KL21]|uniref:sensor domain-containing protein n=1 Tax=Shewanella sp. UCD-KL21 TaxID=1917164 RepID=UPI0009702DA0|nr:GGDEF domain-containing phosphodiesterase [Shewanella sp. UCD-KL21]